MGDVTRILSAIDRGETQAADQLLPLVYEELRKLAAAKLAAEVPGQTLQATALVHEAYLRLVAPGGNALRGVPVDAEQETADIEIISDDENLIPDSRPPTPTFASRSHFFAAAAEAMRRILVDNARRKASLKRGGNFDRVPLDDVAAIQVATPEQDCPDELLALDEALIRLAEHDPQAAQLVKLRYFAGLTMDQAAEVLGISPRSAYYLWNYARSWLHRTINS